MCVCVCTSRPCGDVTRMRVFEPSSLTGNETIRFYHHVPSTFIDLHEILVTCCNPENRCSPPNSIIITGPKVRRYKAIPWSTSNTCVLVKR